MEILPKNNATFLLQNPEMALAFQEIAEYQEYDKHAILHDSGKICNHFYIILSGVARVFYHQEDKNITCHFASEQESITAIDSFIQRKKSKYSVEALEDLKVLAISHADLESLFEKNPKYERYGRLFLQQAYVDLVERMDDIQLHTTQERYEIFLSKRPELFKRVASKHIASYLGMTPETFSRIRSK
jgi:CRP-like cAMP-binding protein